MTKEFKKIKRNGGAAMLTAVVFFLFISLAIISGLVAPTVREFRNANANIKSKQSYFLAESGSEDAAYRIMHNIAISGSETITLGSNSTVTVITALSGSTKQIVSLGDVGSLQRQASVILKTGSGEVFKYGTQAGQGGFVFQNNSHVSGSIYSNGNIIGSNGAYITGDAYVAGSTGLINGMCVGGTIQSGSCSSSTPGHAHAHTVLNSNVAGTIYCQVGTGNNKSCNTSQSDPVSENLPLSDSDIAEWKADAEAGTTTTGDVTISVPTSMGARKIVGNLVINKTLTITDTIYVTGNVTINAISGNPTPASVKLNSSFGATSGIIIADGIITISNGVVFQDSGTTGSYILLLSTSTCDASVTGSPCLGKNAIEVSNNSDISIVNAQQGTVYFSNNAAVKESVGKKIELKNNVGISYGTGLISVDFTSGPSGAWTIDSWAESK